jgi:GntR family transcriptional repressor for pyruvate dehydrogenase complex
MKKIKKTEVSNQIFQNLLKQIVEKKWVIGEKIPSENELAKIFGASRISVREAINKLEALDLIEKEQGRGSFVKGLTDGIFMNSIFSDIALGEHEHVEINEFRKVMEIGMIETIIDRITSGELRKLEEAYNKMVENIENIKIFTKYDQEFHILLAKTTKNFVIVKVSELLRKVINLVILDDYMKYYDLEAALNFHKKILAAIKDKDSNKAKEIINKKYNKVIKRWS